MPKVSKLTKTVIEREILPLKLSIKQNGQEIWWDGALSGFGLKISKDKAVYVVQKRVGPKSVRCILGAYAEFATPEEARDLAREQIRNMRQGVNANAEKKATRINANTLGELVDDYLTTYGPKLRPATQRLYRDAVRKRLKDWQDLPISEIDEQMVATRQIELSNANGPRGKGEALANQTMRILRTLFNHAIETYKDGNKKPIITSNPVKTLKARRLWNKAVSRNDIIADDEIAIWYKSVMQLENENMRDLMVLCLFTGLRRGEASRLKWNKIRLTGLRPILEIPPEDTKTGAPHELPLSDFLVAMLKKKNRVADNMYVFPGEKPGSCVVEPKRAIANVIKDSGVDFSMHTLRRTFGTIAGRLDIAHYKHKMLMNHSMNTEVTGAHYVKLSVEDLREPMQKITDHIVQLAQIDTSFRTESQISG